MFESVLIANRGEIAVRVMRTCRALGIRTIAVYSDVDKQGLHVQQASEAHRIGPAPARDSYLNVAAILRAAKESGAQAVHPGYGFLAENADFAQACIEAGLVWIGPTPEAMRALGDKAAAKALAERARVPLLPGYHGPDQDPDTLAAHADEVGYPLLIKASAGGGGRGMRLVENASDFLIELEAAKREALAAFGSNRVLLERYLRRPRHIEVQVIGDQQGKLLHLGERECSIQRRHQKLLEESPAPGVDETFRGELTDAALRLAAEARYTNAGTVEFIIDEDGAFAFLEVNTRLQVEHPVTEEVNGLDLVELQLRVAAGEPLPLEQKDILPRGHAIEVRVIAEDALNDFLPSTGRIEAFEPPTIGRNEIGVYPGCEVSQYYDSLLAKFIVHETSRAACIEALAGGLRQYEVRGVETNLDLLLAVVEEPAFRSGDISTAFLGDHHIVERLAAVPLETVMAAAVATCQPVTGARSPDSDPWRDARSWRLLQLDMPTVWKAGRELVEARTSAQPGGAGFTVHVAGKEFLAVARNVTRRTYAVSIGSQVLTAEPKGTSDWLVQLEGKTYHLSRAEQTLVASAASAELSAQSGVITAPISATVAKVSIAEGNRVTTGQTLLVLEAMKMEHVIVSPIAGVVHRLLVKQGQTVAGGAVVVEISAES